VSAARRRAASIAEVVLLASWLGAALFFAAGVAPSAFDLLDVALAGALVGRLLPPLFVAGIVTGVAVLATELAWPRRGRVLRACAGGVVVAACAVSQFVLGARIEQLRRAVERPISQLAPDDARRAEFGRLHGLSVAALGAAMVGATVAVASAGRGRATGADEHEPNDRVANGHGA
jgi:hypothetical protein